MEEEDKRWEQALGHLNLKRWHAGRCSRREQTRRLLRLVHDALNSLTPRSLLKDTRSPLIVHVMRKALMRKQFLSRCIRYYLTALVQSFLGTLGI